MGLSVQYAALYDGSFSILCRAASHESSSPRQRRWAGTNGLHVCHKRVPLETHFPEDFFLKLHDFSRNAPQLRYKAHRRVAPHVGLSTSSVSVNLSVGTEISLCGMPAQLPPQGTLGSAVTMAFLRWLPRGYELHESNSLLALHHQVQVVGSLLGFLFSITGISH